MAVKVPVADRFVQAKHDDWGVRRGPTLGFVIHMAEGFNVWRYLSTGNVLRSVSVHFTIEADGEIVQMMGLNRISGSINPNTIRRDNDSNGHYGYTHNRSALGDWWSNPNHCVITVEVAGFNKDGPNEKQLDSIERLFAYLVRRYPSIVPLGHRDFQNVKPCPGTKMWFKAYPRLGGHGKDYKGYSPTDGEIASAEDEMIKGAIQRTSSKYIDLPEGVEIYDSPDGKVIKKSPEARKHHYFGYSGGGWWAIGTWHDGAQVIAYIKKNENFERGDWPAEVDDTTELQARIAQLESALREIRETSKTVLVE